MVRDKFGHAIIRGTVLEQCKHQSSVNTLDIVSIPERSFMYTLNIPPKYNLVY